MVTDAQRLPALERGLEHVWRALMLVADQTPTAAANGLHGADGVPAAHRPTDAEMQTALRRTPTRLQRQSACDATRRDAAARAAAGTGINRLRA